MPQNAEQGIRVSGMDTLSPNESATPETWIPGISRSSANDAIRLICFPFAGGGASVFSPWRNSAHGIDVCAVQYPGRETRWGTPSFPTLAALVDALAVDLSALWHGRFAFWGHSLGAIVAFELTRRLHESGSTVPRHLFLSAARAPHLTPRKSIHHLPAGAFLRNLISYNGMQPEILQNRDLLGVVLPIIKNDFRLFEEYRFDNRDPLPVPISVFGGLKDGNVPIGDLLAWSLHTSSGFRSRFLDGDHFFLFEAVRELSDYIAEDLQAPDESAKKTPGTFKNGWRPE